MDDSGNTAKDHEVRDRELFDRIAVRYCRKDLLPASRLARKYRLHQTLRVVRVSPDITVLEVGCGAGFAVRYLEGQIKSYYGVDYSEKLIGYARANNAGSEAEFVAETIKDFGPERVQPGLCVV